MASWLRWLLPCALCAAVAVSFAPVLWCGFVNWDDGALIVDNHDYRGLAPRNLWWMASTRLAGHYQPLTWLSLGIDYMFWGMRPAGYHLTNLALHTASSALLYLLLLRMLAAAGCDPDRLRTRLAAIAGAAFWALHPLRVESVAWVTERRDVLSTVFYFALLLCYLRMQREPAPCRRKWLLLSVGFMVLSGLAKAWVMTLPAVLLVLDAYPLRRWRREGVRAVLVEKIPFAAVAVAVGVTALMAQRSTGGMPHVERYTVVQRVAVAGHGLAFYPMKTVVPARLSPLYPLDIDSKPSQRRFVVAWAAVLAGAAACVAMRRRWPAMAAAAAAFSIIVSPVLGIAQAGPQEVADRYSYVSCAAWSVALAAAIATQPGWRVAMPVLLAVLGGLGSLTFLQSQIWKNSLTLWNHAVRVDGTNYQAYCNRAHWRADRRDFEGALADFSAAMAIRPHDSAAYVGRGAVRVEMGRYEEAVADLTEAIRLATWPLTPLMSRAVAHMRMGRTDAASRDFDEAIRMAPNTPLPWSNRATARASLGDLRGAVEDFTRAVELEMSPYRRALFLASRAAAWRQLGDLEKARVDVEEALHCNPRSALARRMRGTDRFDRGAYAEAVADFSVLLQEEPRNAEFWMRRGVARHHIGDVDGAIEDLNRSLALRPDSYEALVNRGSLWRVRRRNDLASKDYRGALMLAPADWSRRGEVEAALEAMER